MTIPVVVNVFNRLTTTRALVEQIAMLEGATPVIVDNASDYEPLLEWYGTCGVEVVRLSGNYGHHAPWDHVMLSPGDVVRRYGSDKYVVTDCDLCIRDCPRDLLGVLAEPLHWRRGVIKSGLSLRIDDLPEWQTTVREWESRFWTQPIMGGRFYWAAVDTTFAMYSCSTPFRIAKTVVRARATRSAPPYTARHLPWYLDGNNLDVENQHYFRTANASNSWKPAGQKLDNK